MRELTPLADEQNGEVAEQQVRLKETFLFKLALGKGQWL
jgi:hypothetical protein